MRTRLIITAVLALILASCAGKHQNTQENNNVQTTETSDTALNQSTAVDVAEPTATEDIATTVAPDFTLTDITGNPLTLSSLRGKYVVLDFWGSWCKWCIKGMPEMKAYYEKYAGQFEILGIDCSDSDADWRAAVKQNELPWLHVYNPDDSFLTEQYAIEGYPTKIIVAPDGSIYKVFLGEDPDFYAELDKLFGK